jgi:hypothetical protein
MQFWLFLLFLLLTFATGALLAGRFLLPAKRTVAGIVVLVYWLCLLIGPVQWMAALDLGGLRSFLRVSDLFFWSGLAFACALTLWLLRARHRPRIEQAGVVTELRRRIPRHVALGLLIVLCTYGTLSLRMAFSFPDTWDSVSYHYPVALRWLQEGTMRITDATNWHASLPGNVEILDLLVLSTGRDRLLGFVQWPGVAILLLACLQLGRRLRESAVPEWPVVTTALMIPIVANQSASGYVDLFGTALLFGSLTLVLEYCDQVGNHKEGEARPALLFAAGLAAGLAVGTKPVFWLFAAPLVFTTFFLLSWRGGRPSAWRRLALFLVACAVPSVFWFARAAVCTGNPLYPFSVHVGSLSLPGVRPSDITAPDYYLSSVRHWAELFVYPWIEWKSTPGFLLTNYGPGDGLGGAFATFVMPGVIFAAWLARRRRPDLRVWLLALGLLVIMWWFLLQKVVRFGLPIFVLAVVLSAPFFEVLELRATRLYGLVYVLAFTVTACILVFEPLYTMTQTVRYHNWSRAAYLEYPPIIDTLRPGSRVLNLGHETLNFALAGSGLTNRVIPSWERPPLLTADFLRSRHVDYIVEKLAGEKDDTMVDKGPPVEGLELYFRGSVIEAKKPIEWRIWRTGAGLPSEIDAGGGAKR